MPRSAQGKSFHRLCARFGAVIIVDFYIYYFIFALFIFMKDGKAVNLKWKRNNWINSFEIWEKDNFFTVNAVFSREAGKRSTMGH